MTTSPDIDLDYARGFHPPTNATEVPRWLFWKYKEDRKIPRAPWANPEWNDRFVNAHNPENWLPYDEFLEQKKYYAGQYQPAFSIPPKEEDRDEQLEGDEARLTDLILIDFDDVINERGQVHPRVKHYFKHIESYGQISTSKTGAHIIVQGDLPPGVRTITGDLSHEDWPDAEIEIYNAGRYIAMTGWHISSTPETIEPIENIAIDHFINEYEVTDNSSGGNDRDINHTPEEIADIDVTNDIDVVYDAIDQMSFRGGSNHRLKSEITGSRGADAYDMDPPWADSKSGTRLYCVDGKEGKFFYRDGEIGLSLFQVVALEERIITSERKYPEGEDFWKTVEACRRRGWDIPKYTSDKVPGKYQDIDTDAFERDSTRTLRVFSAAMHHTTTDEVETSERFTRVSERTFKDTMTDELASPIDAVAVDVGVIDEPSESIPDRAHWIKTGHAMQARGATIPSYHP